MTDKIAGYIEVGINLNGDEIVINFLSIELDENGAHFLTFSPNQARHLANLLLEKATEIDGSETTLVAFSKRINQLERELNYWKTGIWPEGGI